MKKTLLFLFISLLINGINAGEIKKTFSFSNYQISEKGTYTTVSFEGLKLSGIPGEPMMPYQALSLLLPPGEKAVSIEITGSDEQVIPGTYQIAPLQFAQPVSSTEPAPFVKNEAVYKTNASYPSVPEGHLITNYLNGYAFALSAFTPVKYNPVSGKISYYRNVTVTVKTSPSAEAENALKNLTTSKTAMSRVRMMAQNPEMISAYPSKKSALTAYQTLIITAPQFVTGFESLVTYYQSIGINAQVQTTEYITSNVTGQDLPEKIRNYIIQEYQNNDIEYVLLGGDIEHVPFRGFYCYVNSGSGYTDENIPADIYFSGLDGNWNTNNNELWAEPGEEDVLPEVSVARFPFSTAAQLQAMVHKTVSYQSDPVEGEWKEPYLVSENLYDNPITFGSDYLELLIDQHNDNGYSTFGIPSASNTITRLYDTLISPPNNYYMWTTQDVIQGINEGKTFIHHSGHSNFEYMMRLFGMDITDANFAMVNGIDHNYTLMYTHGCMCGGFDFNDCIAERAVTINNFLVGGVFNSRYGWFNQGTTDGPSEHLHREFISAMYNDTVPETHLGTAHMISKMKTAPFIALPGEFEPGAQRWCMYDCNAFGDPALKIWTTQPSGVGVPPSSAEINWTVYPVPAKESLTVAFDVQRVTDVKIDILNMAGQAVAGKVLKNVNQGHHSEKIDISELASGAYTCRISMKEGSSVRKVMKMR